MTGGLILVLLLAIGGVAVAVSKPARAQGSAWVSVGILGCGLGIYMFGQRIASAAAASSCMPTGWGCMTAA